MATIIVNKVKVNYYPIYRKIYDRALCFAPTTFVFCMGIGNETIIIFDKDVIQRILSINEIVPYTKLYNGMLFINSSYAYNYLVNEAKINLYYYDAFVGISKRNYFIRCITTSFSFKPIYAEDGRVYRQTITVYISPKELNKINETMERIIKNKEPRKDSKLNYYRPFLQKINEGLNLVNLSTRNFLIDMLFEGYYMLRRKILDINTAFNIKIIK